MDEAVGEKIFSRAQELFTRRPLGEELHLTYRIPAFDGEKMHRMARAFMNILSLADLSKDIGLARPAVTEMFLPLTTSADQPRKVRETFKEVMKYHRAIFHTDSTQDSLMQSLFEVTPLVEDVDSLLSIEKILQPYWSSLVKEKPDIATRGQRIFLARSDPAMNAGLMPAVLAVKVALSTISTLSSSLGFAAHPILGTGSLPFRGSVNPTYTDPFLRQYAGTRTYSIQSAFRYDYPKEEAKQALEKIRAVSPTLSTIVVPDADKQRIIALCKNMSALWRPTIESIAPLINAVAAHVPPRRERLQHIGLFGYSRGIGKVRLPRAIGFTAALYSIGVPPEFITTGRGLRLAQTNNQLDLLETYYPALRDDLQHAGKYLNRENLSLLAKSDAQFVGIQEDIAAIESILGIQLTQEKPHHLIHRNLTSSIYQRLMADENDPHLAADIVEAGIIRKSLG